MKILIEKNRWQVSCFLLAIISVFMSAVPVLAQKAVMYCGEVSYEYEKTSEASGSGGAQDKGVYIWSAAESYHDKFTGKWQVCMKGKEYDYMPVFSYTAHTLSTSIEWNQSGKSSCRQQHKETGCPNPDGEGTTPVRPGDGFLKAVDVQAEPKDVDMGSLPLGGSLVINKNGAFQINFSTKFPYRWTYSSREVTIQACEPDPPPTDSNTVLDEFYRIGFVDQNVLGTKPGQIGGDKTFVDKTSDKISLCGEHCWYDKRGVTGCQFQEKGVYHYLLTRYEGDCMAMISHTKGDVKIDGTPVQDGPRAIGKGQTITTGSHSRVQFDPQGTHSSYRLGSDTKLEIKNNWCDEPESNSILSSRLPGGKAYAIVHKLTGSDPIMECTRSAGAVRGEMNRMKGIYYALTDLSNFLTPEALAEEVFGLEPTPEEINSAELVFMAEVAANGNVSVKVLKGSVKIKHMKSNLEKILNENEMFDRWDDGTYPQDIVIWSI